MRFIIHVLDFVSSHKNSETGFILDKSLFQSLPIDVLESDVFYACEAEDEVSAVLSISNIIQAEVPTGRKKLSDLLIETKKSLNVSDFSSDTPEEILTDNALNVKQNAYGKFFTATCHVPKNGFVEVHRVEFFVVAENKIIEIEGN
jgi:hypothetical protein